MKKILIGVVVVVAIIFLIFMMGSNDDAKDTNQAASDTPTGLSVSGGVDYGQEIAPSGVEIPSDANPVENTNPFDTKNPFE